MEINSYYYLEDMNSNFIINGILEIEIKEKNEISKEKKM